MSDLLELLTQQVGQHNLEDISRQLGTDSASAQKGLEAGLSAVLGGLARNANASPQGAESLARALERDHDGSVLDNVGGLLGMLTGGQPAGRSGGGGLGALLDVAGQMMGSGNLHTGSSKTLNGDGILGHVFGDRRGTIEQSVSQASGLDTSQVAKLLPMLAPLVMGALGKMKRQQNLDAGGLATVLNQQRGRVQQRNPQLDGLMGMLDADGDGDITDDLTKLGGSLLGSLFGGKK